MSDVSGHVVGSIADVVSGQLDGLGSPEATAREVAERKGRSPGESVEELTAVTKLATDIAAVFDDDTWDGPGPGGYNGTLGQGVEALWYDTYLHAEDIRVLVRAGLPCGEQVCAPSVHHVAHELDTRGWGPATLAFEGIEEVPVGAGGPKHTGDALEFVLVATGRADAGALGSDGPINIYV